VNGKTNGEILRAANDQNGTIFNFPFSLKIKHSNKKFLAFILFASRK
jgi:hypothetical protein